MPSLAFDDRCTAVICCDLNPDWFAFLVPAHLGSPGKRAVKRACACANVDVWMCVGSCRVFCSLCTQTTVSADWTRSSRVCCCDEPNSRRTRAPANHWSVLAVSTCLKYTHTQQIYLFRCKGKLAITGLGLLCCSVDSQSSTMWVSKCFDTVGWASGRAFGLKKLSDEVLVC